MFCRHAALKMPREGKTRRKSIPPNKPLSHGKRAKKVHKLFSHKLSVPPFVPGFVPGTTKGLSQGQYGFARLPLCKIRRKPGFVPGFHRVVPGTNRVCPQDKPGENPRPTGQKSLCLCAFFLPERGNQLKRNGSELCLQCPQDGHISRVSLFKEAAWISNMEHETSTLIS